MLRRILNKAILALVLLVLAGPVRAERHPAIGLGGIDIPAALAREAPPAGRVVPVTGLGVPHHLLAIDLIARGFMATKGNRYDRILLIGPDHFFKSRRPAAVTQRGFETAFGPVESDKVAVARLLESPELFDPSDLFDGEHGTTGLMPFVRLVHPDVPVVAVALGIGTGRAEWDRIADALKAIVTPQTLIVQSTDYSHYLLPHLARQHDQQTLNVLSARDLDALSALKQPAHLDSKAANYIQMRLQAEVFGAAPAVIANRTAFDYIPVNEPTTSYIVTAYGPDPVALGRLVYGDQQVHFFGGDVFVGRYFLGLLASPAIRDRILGDLRTVTGRAPLTVNLEGAMLPDVPHGLPRQRHAMPAGLTLEILKALNVTSASLANNHSHDLGKLGFNETIKVLKDGGIKPLKHLEPVDLGPFRLVALNFIGVGDFKGYPAALAPGPGADDLAGLCRLTIRAPVIAVVHWGEEYTDAGGKTEQAIAHELARCGIGAVIGAHSHKASVRPVLTAGGEQVMVYSVGNLLFDQFSTTSSGALVELRVFARGTFALRMVPVPNLYERALELRSGDRAETDNRKSDQ
ncbi:MAG: AmmeMemoRadiSam system protein B [Proteobacteria bacterium]|nr:AmmeMemoRadiSam system protein B [Pseudomonadota bacterium]